MLWLGPVPLEVGVLATIQSWVWLMEGYVVMVFQTSFDFAMDVLQAELYIWN